MLKIIRKILNNRLLMTGSLSLFSTVLVRAVNLISIPIFSRLLTTAEYGNVDVFINYANIFMFILGLDTHAGISKAKIDFKDDSDAYMSSNLIFSTVFSVVIISVINVFFTFLQGIFGLDRLTTNIMLIYGYTLYVISFRTAENNFDYQYKKNIIMNGTVAILNLAISVLFVLTVFDNNRQFGRIIGATIPTIICAVIVYLFICIRGRWKVKKSHILYALKFGVPLVPHNLSHIILSSADRIMIKNMISSSDAGIYSLSYSLGMLLSVITEGLNQFFMPWMFRKIDQDKTEDVTKGQRLYLMAFMIITIIVMAISPEIVKLIGAEEYWDGVRIVIWIVFAVFLNFTYTLYVNIEFFYLKSVWISIGTISAAIINCVLNVIFLNKYGYAFGAISTVISYALLLAFHMIIVNYILKKRYTDNVFVIIIAIVMLVISFGMNLLRDRFPLRVITGVLLAMLAGVAMFIVYKKQGKLDITNE